MKKNYQPKWFSIIVIPFILITLLACKSYSDHAEEMPKSDDSNVDELLQSTQLLDVAQIDSVTTLETGQPENTGSVAVVKTKKLPDVAKDAINSTAEFETEPLSDRKLAVVQLIEMLALAKTYSAKFQQNLKNEKGEVLEETTGAIAWRRPSALRWQITAPIEQTILVNKNRYHQYDSDLDQLIIEPLNSEAAAIPNLLLSGDTEGLLNQFIVEKKYDQDNKVIFHLVPRQQLSSSLFKAIDLDFMNKQLSAIVLLDDLEQTTKIAFEDIVLNETLSDALFLIEPPEGTDVIYR